MLAFVKDIIEKQLFESKSSILLEEFELFGDQKLAATISTSHLMGSVEILKNLTTDLLIVEFESEDIIYSKTFEIVRNIDDLKEIIKKYVCKIDDFERYF